MTQNIPPETQQKITQLQMLEQALQNSSLQKQQTHSNLIEINSAIQELEKTDKAYKIIGNLMVNSTKEELQKDLATKKESLELKLKTIEDQETRLKEKTQNLQKEVMESIQG